jgi:hypothetical protein
MANLNLQPVLDMIESDISLLSASDQSDHVKAALKELEYCKKSLVELRKNIGTLDVPVELA